MKKQIIISGKIVSLHGIIIPADWDDKGKAIAYTLSTFDEKEYPIDPEVQDPLVEEFIGEKVAINGILSINEQKQYLHIQTIRHLQ